jgi:hypothetical protein
MEDESDSATTSISCSEPPLPGDTNVGTKGSGVWKTLTTWKKKLVTQEDFLHVHKILGVLVLISFLYRMTQLFDDMGFPSHPEWTVPTILLHWLLPISALQFRIPVRRIRDGGRIWPQFRWHSIAFTSRSCFCVLLYYYEHQYHWQPQYWINYLVLMANMALVDASTWYYGPEFSSNTIREIEAPGFVKFAFSLMQFNASMGMLFGLRSYAIPYFMLYVIQLTPFIGTLRRKGLFPSDIGGALLYALLLVSSFAVQSIQYYRAGGERLHLFVRTGALAAAVLRLAPLPSDLWPLQNKYVIWTILYAVVQQVRPMLLTGTNATPAPSAESVFGRIVTDLFTMRVTFVALFSLLILSGYMKIQSGYYPKNVQDAKKETKKLQ